MSKFRFSKKETYILNQHRKGVGLINIVLEAPFDTDTDEVRNAINKYKEYMASRQPRPVDNRSFKDGEIYLKGKVIKTCRELTGECREDEPWFLEERKCLVHILKEAKAHNEESALQVCNEGGMATYFDRTNWAIYQKACQMLRKKK
jgi:hypothetical protein